MTSVFKGVTSSLIGNLKQNILSLKPYKNQIRGNNLNLIIYETIDSFYLYRFLSVL
jgi:hypothetical protein